MGFIANHGPELARRPDKILKFHRFPGPQIKIETLDDGFIHLMVGVKTHDEDTGIVFPCVLHIIGKMEPTSKAGIADLAAIEHFHSMVHFPSKFCIELLEMRIIEIAHRGIKRQRDDFIS